MTKFNIYSILLLLSLAATTTSAKKEESLLECSKDIGPHCGVQIYEKIFDNDKSNIEDECCHKIVEMGHSCHTKMTKRVLQTDPKYSVQNQTDFLAKSDQIFYECEEAIQVADPKVGKCLQKIGFHCGVEVNKNLVSVHNQISKDCCDKLLKIGRSCHLRIVKYSVQNDPEIWNVNATQVLKNAKEMFRKCKLGC